MTLAKVLVTGFSTLVFTVGCSTTKYKSFASADALKAETKDLKGKTPKEVAQKIGQPMSAYYSPDKNTYYMVYPESSTEVSMTDLMFNDRLECLFLNFEKEKNFKFDNWQSNVGSTCAAIKGNTLDMSLIE